MSSSSPKNLYTWLMRSYDVTRGKLWRLGGENGFSLKLGEFIGPADCPMLRRWVIITPLGSIRLHNFLRSDDERDPHDHPWWFLTVMLKGAYTDFTTFPDGTTGQDRLSAGSIRFRPAKHRHMVKTTGAWTLIITGRNARSWGFWERMPDSLSQKFHDAKEYFHKYGYAACE